MKATTGAGKGGLPREGQYSKKAQKNYSKGYDRAFGKECSTCRGRGYMWNTSLGLNVPVKITCLMCNGTGRVKK